jgi:hypothetical protein
VIKHCFYTGAFSTSFLVLSAIYSEIEQSVCIKFCVKLGRSVTETLEMLHEIFGEHSLSMNGIHVSRPVECHWKMTNILSGQAQTK